MIRRPPRSTLSLHDALPISQAVRVPVHETEVAVVPATPDPRRLERHAHREPLGALDVVLDRLPRRQARRQEEAVEYDIERPDRKSTRLNSSHGYISYAGFCLKKKRHFVI